MLNWKGYVRNWPWSCLEGLKKNVENLIKDSISAEDSNQASPEYELVGVLLRSRDSVVGIATSYGLDD
jgi:hypothetical protein